MLKNAGGKIRAFFTLKSLSREPLIFSAYAAVVLIMTYPAITLTSRTYADPKDPLGGLWWLWWLRYSFFEQIPVTPVSIVGVPSGLNINPYRTDPLFNLGARFLSIISTETIAYNIILLLSFFLTAVFSYYLVKYLTGNIYAAVLSGFVLGFCPFILVQGKEHLGLTAVFWIPLFFLLLIRSWTQRSLGNLIGCSAVFVLITLYNYQYGFIAGVCALFFSLALWLSGRPLKKKSRDVTGLLKTLPFIIAVFIIIAVLFTVFTGSPAAGGRNISEAYKYSARPWDYLIPHAESSALGYLTRDFIVNNIHGSFTVENSLFPGYVPLFLAIFAVVTAFAGLVRKKNEKPSGGFEEPYQKQEPPESAEPNGGSAQKEITRAITPDRLIFSFAACGLFAFFVSMPPSFSLFGVKIYMPSYLLHRLVPQFRVYARFGMITVFCVAVLCGYAASKIIELELLKKWKLPAIVIVSILVLFEFSIVPPFYSLNTKETTDYYRWLEAQPGKPVTAVYPLFYIDSFYNYGYFFQQRIHKKPLINGAGADSLEETRRQSIMDITGKGTPGLLKELKTEYVLVIPALYEIPKGWDLNFPFPAEIDLEKIPPGLDMVKNFNDCVVYKVTAEKPGLFPLYGQGFYQSYMDPEGKFRHPAVTRAEIMIDSMHEEPVACRLNFEAGSPGPDTTLTVFLNGVKISSFPVSRHPRDLPLEGVTLNPGRNRLELVSDGGLYYLREVPGYSDVQAAMIVGDITLEKAP
ncbi:MAG: hypothetical protein JXA49_02545 [Actinobacteria bacterium]|nr:hypothetical protein [Actinomycetota bacterium]